ncbi:MAG: hypothetical protein AAGA66_20380, partial [Bacteroidota bacterium]
NEESISLITDMISQTKQNLVRGGGSFYFLLWGWVVLVANLGHYVMAKFDLYDAPYVIWMITIPAFVVSFIYGARNSRNKVIKGHLDRMYGLIWLAIFIAVIIILGFTLQSGEDLNPIILTFAGLGTFLSGNLLRFKPLILGGISLWIASVIAFNISPVDQYLAGTLGILAGYLVPGYLLRKIENEQF